LTGRAAAVLVFPGLGKVPTIGSVVLEDAFAPKNEPARAGGERTSRSEFVFDRMKRGSA
jgi:hypothetical protein